MTTIILIILLLLCLACFFPRIAPHGVQILALVLSVLLILMIVGESGGRLLR